MCNRRRVSATSEGLNIRPGTWKARVSMCSICWYLPIYMRIRSCINWSSHPSLHPAASQPPILASNHSHINLFINSSLLTSTPLHIHTYIHSSIHPLNHRSIYSDIPSTQTSLHSSVDVANKKLTQRQLKNNTPTATKHNETEHSRHQLRVTSSY